MSTVKQSATFGINGPVRSDDIDTVGSDARITKIVVDHGEIIDQFVITYQTPSGTQVRTHGQGGGVVTTINFAPNEVLIGAYGTAGAQSTTYGPSSITFLQFVILDKSTGSVRVEGPFGASRRGAQPFAVTGEIVAFAVGLTNNSRFVQSLTFHYKNE